MLFTPPVALLLSIVGIRADERRAYGIAGLIVSGATCAMFLLLFVTAALA